MPDTTPRRFAWPVPPGQRHPNGSDERRRTGCYFPATNLLATDTGERGTGLPNRESIEWLDEPPAGTPIGPPRLRRDPPRMHEMLGQPDDLNETPRVLDAPAAHSLQECLRGLRFGRPALQQNLLTRLADLVDARGVDAVIERLDEETPSEH